MAGWLSERSHQASQQLIKIAKDFNIVRYACSHVFQCNSANFCYHETSVHMKFLAIPGVHFNGNLVYLISS